MISKAIKRQPRRAAEPDARALQASCGMNSISAIQLLRDDHKKLRGLFRQVEVIEMRAPEMKIPVVKEIFEEIAVHSALEEQIFYPLVHQLIQERFKGEGNESGLIDQSFSDHNEISELIRQSSVAQDFSKLEEIIGLVEAHVETEEKELFPFVEKHFAEHLERMGLEMSLLKETLRAKNGITDAAQPGHPQNPNRGEQIRTA
jgi:hemerythrin-like domain-containing protein